ncbi:hypothetical protein [Rhodococcus qingshengii]|uniref:hypothetical protein n=1 Tax=Rhodococcus qingshengii TaxID=334542 RepID=UPI001E615AF0|nr:hypothetical protein [Rhodococcus qingshengii]UDF20129.1 hypothetical protein LE551_23025 [Rhodococcus qingshengii]
MRIQSARSLTAGVQSWAVESDDESEELSIDLSAAEFIDTLGLVAVAVAAEDARSYGRTVNLRLPTALTTRNWLSRMHLRAGMESIGVPCPLSAVNESPLGDRLLELHRFDSSSPDELAEKVYAILSGDDPEEAGELYTSVAEAAANVCDHSGAEGGWAALRQVGTGLVRTVEFAVADSGVGLRSSLSRANGVDNDVHAMHLAVTKGVSGTGLRHRGLGLADIAASATGRQGLLRLFSGRAEAKTKPNGDLHARESQVRYPGTLLYATLKFESGRSA